MDDLKLPALFSRALGNASKSATLLTIDDNTQALVTSALRDLTLLDSRVNDLALFSSNETVDDISTPHLVYLFVPFAAAELQGRIKAFQPQERTVIVGFRQRHLNTFVHSLEEYEIITPEDRQQNPSAIQDPAKRRALKIAQHMAEKEIRSNIETLRKRRQQSTTPDSGSDLAIIASLLPSVSTELAGKEDQEEDQDTEDVLRQATLLVLRLCYGQAQSQLESLNQELELLKFAPSIPLKGPSVDLREKQKQPESDTWKLDLQPGPSKGPLLDEAGKPLQPFTILPSNATDRMRLQSEVFRPGYNLPTMSIDEYLEIEQQRGNVITGGGPQSLENPTTSEQLALDAEMDGTKDGEEKEEFKRQKDENWAQFTDVNPRGAGNTMNRG